MRRALLCLCCLGLIASLALADGELQTLIAGERVAALQAARLGPDGMVSDWVDVGPGLRGSPRQLIWDCYEPDVEDCTGQGFYGQTIGFRSCGYGEPEDCSTAGSPNCSSRWFYGDGLNVNLYSTNDMVFDSAYGGTAAKDMYFALHWYVTGPGSGENCAILIETYEEFDETCTVGDPGDPGFDNNTSDPGYIMGVILNFGYVDSGANLGYGLFYAEDLAPDVQLELPSDGAGSYNLWYLTYTGDSPTWPDDYMLATSAQPMLWGTGDHEWINEDTVNRGEGCTEHDTMWRERSGLPDFHEPNSDDCWSGAIGVCPDPVGTMLALCISGEPQCPGDIDGDGDTDHSDLGELLSSWCSHDGDPNWNPNADLDNDGHVGHGDLGTLLADWGCGT